MAVNYRSICFITLARGDIKQLLFCEKSQNATNSTTFKAREKISPGLGMLRILEIFVVYLAKFKSNSILLNKIGYRFPLTTNLLILIFPSAFLCYKQSDNNMTLDNSEKEEKRRKIL